MSFHLFKNNKVIYKLLIYESHVCVYIYIYIYIYISSSHELSTPIDDNVYVKICT